MTTTIGRTEALHQRRRMAAERLSVIDAALASLDAEITGSAGTADSGAVLRVVRALLPLGLDDPTFDVTVTVGPADVAVRVHHVPGRGITARLAGEAALPSPPQAAGTTPSGHGSSTVAELAELLRRRHGNT